MSVDEVYIYKEDRFFVNVLFADGVRGHYGLSEEEYSAIKRGDKNTIDYYPQTTIEEITVTDIVRAGENACADITLHFDDGNIEDLDHYFVKDDDWLIED